MRSVIMDSSEDNSRSCMVLRSGYAKWFLDQPEQTTDLSRRATSRYDNSSSLYTSEVSHHYNHHERGHRYEMRVSPFTPDLTSTPLLFSSETNLLARDGCCATFGGILSSNRGARSYGTNKKVHFEVRNGTCQTEQNDVADVRPYALEGDVKSSFLNLEQESATLKQRWTQISDATVQTSVKTHSQGHNGVETNGTTWSGCLGFQKPSSAQLLTAMTKMRPGTSKSRDMFSSDEEDVTSDTTGLSTESNASYRPVFIIKDAASYARLSSREPGHASSQLATPSTSNSVTNVLSAVSFSVWTTIYKSICSVLLFDAWLLSRFTEKQRRRLGVLLLLFLLPVVFWPYISSKESSLSPIASAASGAATSFWDSIGKASSAAGSSLMGIPSLFRAASFSWPTWHSVEDHASKIPVLAEEVVLPRGRLGDEELRSIVRALVAEQLQKWESGKSFVSRDQVEKMSAQVEETLQGKLDGMEERNRVVAADVDELRTKVEQLGTANDELRLADDKLKACSHDNKELLENFDAKIAAAVLEVLNQPSALRSETAFHRWILSELSTRDSRLSIALDDLRHQVAAAAAKSERADRASQEATRLASEKNDAVCSQVGGLAGTKVYPDGGGVGNIDVKRVVREALMLYDADKTAMPDYALESAGGSVVNTRCTETYGRGTAHYQVFGIPIWTMTRTPREAIQPGVSPGECWAFRGSQGNLVLQLAMTIHPTGFTVEHIPKSLAIGGNLDSAPKEFTILGLESDKDYKGKVLGKYVYDINGDPLQYFAVQESDPGSFRFVEMQITSNHGNLEYTCLYRIRVHGVPSS